MPSDEEVLTYKSDEKCPECGRGYVEARLAPGHYYLSHGGECSQNSANQVCERCGGKHVEMTFDKALSCIMDVSPEEGRDLQQRIVKRLSG